MDQLPAVNVVQGAKKDRPPVCKTAGRPAPATPEGEDRSTKQNLSQSPTKSKAERTRQEISDVKLKRKPAFSPMQRLLKGYGLNAVHLSMIWGVAYNTAAARLREPATLTLRELQLVSDQAGIPMEEIRACIRK